jgi:hypothetical protein
MVSPEELSALDDFGFKQRMLSRAAAVRELFRLGLASTGIYVPIASLPTLGCCLPSRTTRRGRSIERSVTSNAVMDHHFRNPDLDP